MAFTGTVQVAEIQAGWQQPLDVKGLTWTEPQAIGGRQLTSVEQIRTTQALLDIVKGMACSQCLALDALDVLATKYTALWYRFMSCQHKAMSSFKLQSCCLLQGLSHWQNSVACSCCHRH